MEYAACYVANENDQCIKMQRINRVRLYKRMFLPFKLVNVDRGQPINAYYNQ